MRGANLAIAIACIVLATSTLNAIGFYDAIGVSVTTGAEGEVERIHNTSEMSDPSSSTGSGFVGMADTGLRFFDALWAWTGFTDSLLMNIGVPGPIAYPIHLVVDVSMGWSFVMLLRGLPGGG